MDHDEQTIAVSVPPTQGPKLKTSEMIFEEDEVVFGSRLDTKRGLQQKEQQPEQEEEDANKVAEVASMPIPVMASTGPTSALMKQSTTITIAGALEEAQVDWYDDTVVTEFRQFVAKRNKSVTSKLLVEFLFLKGLVYDGQEAEKVLMRWDLKNLMTDIPITPLGPTDTKKEKAKKKKHRDALARIQKAYAARFPGLHGNEMELEDILRPGDSLRLGCSGGWVSCGGTSTVMLQMQRKVSRQTGLFVRYKKPAEFHVVTIEKTLDKDVGAEAVVEYGDLVFLQTVAGQVHKVSFICPGRTGPVHFGHHLFIVGLDETPSGEDFIRPSWTMGAPTMGQSKSGTPIVLDHNMDGDLSSPVCFTVMPVEGTMQELVPDAPSGPAEPLSFNLLSYSVWMLPPPFHKVSFRKHTRARLIPACLKESLSELDPDALHDDKSGKLPETTTPDVVLLCDAFDHAATRMLKARLKREFGMAFETPLLGVTPFHKDRSLTNGGVTVLSRYPIVDANVKLFGSLSAKDDRFANKGILHVTVCKAGTKVHVFGTHLQSWDNGKAADVRTLQLVRLREFVRELAIPEEEFVVIAGDLNVDRVNTPEKYDTMLDILRATDASPPLEVADLVDLQSSSSRKVSAAKSGLRRPTRSLRWSVGTPLLKRLQSPSLSADADGSGSSQDLLPAAHEAMLSTNEIREGSKMDEILTFNPNANSLAAPGLSSSGIPGILDYVLISVDHKQPATASTYVLHNCKTKNAFAYGKHTHHDLSNHFPVFAQFTLR